MKNDLKIAISIIRRDVIRFKNKEFYNEESRIYKMSNEKIKYYIKYFKNRSNILSVIASGDQIINSILMGVNDIDAFDISTFPKYFLFLKIAAIKSLSKEEYLDFFCVNKNKKINYNELYLKIRKNLHTNNLFFWDTLFKIFNWETIYSSSLFYSEDIVKYHFESRNIYLQNNNFEKTKNLVKYASIRTYTGNIINLCNKLNKEYDLIYLSNIYNYLSIDQFGYVLDNLKVKENGIILSYIFNFDKNNVYRIYNKTDNITIKDYEEKRAPALMIYKSH